MIYVMSVTQVGRVYAGFGTVGVGTLSKKGSFRPETSM